MSKNNEIESARQEVKKIYLRKLKTLDEDLPFMKKLSKRHKSVFVLLAIADITLQKRNSYKYLEGIIRKATYTFLDKDLLEARFRRVESSRIAATEKVRKFSSSFGAKNALSCVWGAFLASFVSEAIADSSLPVTSISEVVDDVSSIHLLFDEIED